MKTRILATMALAGLTMASAAFAATTTVGTIKAINETAPSVTLSDGTVYTLTKDMKLADFKVGDKISVQWEMNGTAHEVIAISPAS